MQHHSHVRRVLIGAALITLSIIVAVLAHMVKEGSVLNVIHHAESVLHWLLDVSCAEASVTLIIKAFVNE